MPHFLLLKQSLIRLNGSAVALRNGNNILAVMVEHSYMYNGGVMSFETSQDEAYTLFEEEKEKD